MRAALLVVLLLLALATQAWADGIRAECARVWTDERFRGDQLTQRAECEQDNELATYLEQVRRKIKANWGFPCIPEDSGRRCDYKTTQLVVEFGIVEDGRVLFTVVRDSSGYPIYDKYAVKAIKFSSPFPPVPDSVGSRTIKATFRYVVSASLTNLLQTSFVFGPDAEAFYRAEAARDAGKRERIETERRARQQAERREREAREAERRAREAESRAAVDALRIGMTPDQVREILGAPRLIERKITAAGRIETWMYLGTAVQFTEGRVDQIHTIAEGRP